jgi:hypothetical protein
MEAKMKKAIEGAVIFFDSQDAKNAGWAYNVVADGDHTSGSLGHTRRSVSMATLVRSLRREFREGSLEIPARGWTPRQGGYAIGSLA